MTEENNLPVAVSNDNDAVKIYSKRAILGFSILFAPIFGGVLLRQNLVDVKKKKEANIVLLVSIGFSLLTLLIVNSMEPRNSSVTYLLNMAGGVALSEFFFKKYFPGNDYRYKKIWKALLISLLIIIPLILILIYAPAA